MITNNLPSAAAAALLESARGLKRRVARFLGRGFFGSRRRAKGMLALVLSAGGISALANSYFWTAGGANDYWDTYANWSPLFNPGTYPQSSDDVIISNTSNGDDILLITVSVDDVSISDDVNFAPKAGVVTLTADTITIGGASAVTVTMTGATMRTQP